jgi:hypothetical protein
MLKRIILTFLVAVILFFLVVAVIKTISKEDTWICSNGQWVEHGHPSDSKPVTPCVK